MRIGSVYSGQTTSGHSGGPSVSSSASRATYASSSRTRSPIMSHPLLASVLSGTNAELLQMDSVGIAATARLAAQGLSWAPMVANITVGATYSFFVYLNSVLGGALPLQTSLLERSYSIHSFANSLVA
jgi:hypothetical protein